MRSSKLLRALFAAMLTASSAAAQQQPPQAQGFDLERMYTSAPGAGWFVMDAIDMHGQLGGAVAAVTSYARNPLRVTDGTQHISVVSDEAFLQIGAAGTYDRFRVYASFDSPLTVQGHGGVVGGYAFSAPSMDPGTSPDAISHARFGADMRLLGEHAAPFRLGLGAQLWLPGGSPGSLRTNYLSDGPPGSALGAYAAQARGLFAGDVGVLAYAGHVGLYLRQVDDRDVPGSPRGSEALFGAAAGAKIAPCDACGVRLVVGPEVFGATALASFLATNATALEGLLTGRLEGTAEDRAQIRVKLGAGGGLNARFGAPEARFVLGVELFDSGGRP